MINNLLIRSISGLVFLVILIGGILIDKLSFYFVFTIISTLSIFEFYNLAFREKARSQIVIGMLLNAIIFTTNYLYATDECGQEIFLIYIPFITFIYLFELYANNKRPFLNIAYTLFGFIYVSIPFALLNYIVFYKAETESIFQPEILLGFFCIIWTNDTFAYLFGISFGKYRIFPRVSPKKSWEGTIGGAVSTLLLTYYFSPLIPQINPLDWLIISAIIIVAGIYGDLVESLFKRSINIKDSGNIIPGHGGVLDRFDSMILASPLVFLYIHIISV